MLVCRGVKDAESVVKPTIIGIIGVGLRTSRKVMTSFVKET